MADNSRAFGGTSADKISKATPTGPVVDAAWSMGAWAFQTSTAGDGRVILKMGPANAVAGGGVMLHTDSSNALRVRQSNGQFAASVAAVTVDTWHRVGATRAGSGVANITSILNGTGAAQNTDAPDALEAGDVFQISDQDTDVGCTFWAGRVAWAFWLQGVALSAAALDGYLQDPEALVTDYGPSGGVTANALKILWPCQCNTATEEDQSGVGNDGTITGTTLGSGDGPSPSTAWTDVCGGGGGGGGTSAFRRLAVEPITVQ